MATTVSLYWRQQRKLARPPSCAEVRHSYSYTDLPGDSVESRRKRLLAITRCAEHRNDQPQQLCRDPPARERPYRELTIRETNPKEFFAREQNSRNAAVDKCSRDTFLRDQGCRDAARDKGARDTQRDRADGGSPEVSVKRRGEELARAARAQVRTQRLNVESGWSKVEEVRKRFEDAASAPFSRSFESPPRRRLADSLFASLKLPRRKSAAAKLNGATVGPGEPAMMAQPRSPAQPQHKRKSAVELLAETKAFYVKSETVRDRKQELPIRMSSGLGQAIASGGCVAVSSNTVNPACCQPYGNTTVPRPACNSGGARVGTGGSVQSTLRRLLRHEDSITLAHKPRLHSGTLPTPPKHRQRECIYMEPVAVTQELVNTYSIPSPLSSPERVPPPPAARDSDGSPTNQYSHSHRDRYIRSNSQSAATARRDSGEDAELNINSHKSLPDLHTHVRTYNDNVSTSGAETMGRSPRRRRHSTHQRTASCSSKGTRSNHSSLVSSCEAFSEHPSPGEDNFTYNRCGSALARDSGGSSGHCTQRSALAHPHNRSYYATLGYADELPDWPVSAPPQFQDGAPSPPQAAPCHHYLDTRVSIHLQASAPPPQFQDEPPAREERECGQRAAPGRGWQPTRADLTRDYTRFEASPEDQARKSLVYAEPRVVRPSADSVEYVNTPKMGGGAEEVTSPLGTFKRQRCLRYKQRKARPILRSKSDISDSRYRRAGGRSPASAPCDDDSPDSGSESARLRHFFAHLGLERRAYERLVDAPAADAESPVFFSDVSTVDSNQLNVGGDYTVQGPAQARPAHRSAEPPSVVERNARIIKWLCNCRKTQLAQ